MSNQTNKFPLLEGVGKNAIISRQNIKIPTDEGLTVWIPIKDMAKKQKVSVQSVLNRIRAKKYEARQLFSLVLVKQKTEKS